MNRTLDEQHIRESTRQLEAAWNAADGRAFAALFSDDADFTVFDGKRLSGREEIAKDHAHSFATGNKDTTATFTIERLRFLGSDAAVVHLDVLIVKKHRQLSASEERMASPVAIFQRVNDLWRIVAFANVVRRIQPEAHHPDNR
jgi:uncharacterized protein (TIGR02246 family)